MQGVLGATWEKIEPLAAFEEVFWPGYAEQVRHWCRTCVRCAMRKNPPKTRHGALQSIRTGYPMQMVAADIIGPLPASKNGNRYILVASDYFTRWVEAYAISNQGAITVARKFGRQYVLSFFFARATTHRYGCPV